jgi:hypothetical protein
MEEEKNEEPIVFEVQDNEIIKETPQPVQPPVKVKKPRSEKQQAALKAMLKKRQEMAVVQRAERKEKRAPKWYRELNAQDKEIQELKDVIEMLKEHMIEDRSNEVPSRPPVNEPIEDEEEPEETPTYGLKNGVYYRPPKIVHQVVRKPSPPPMERFSAFDRLSLLHRIL